MAHEERSSSESMDQPGAGAPPNDPTSSTGDASGGAGSNLACQRCNHDLSGLSETGQCPGCGTPIGVSAHGDLLRYADPDWVATLARGANLVTGSMVAMICVSVLFAALALCGTWWFAPAVAESLRSGQISADAARTAIFVGDAIVKLAVGATVLVAGYGVWLLTKPEPSRVGKEPHAVARKTVRVAVVAVALSLYGGGARSGEEDWPRLLAGAQLLIGVLLMGLLMAATLAYIGHLTGLAHRIPSNALYRRGRLVFKLASVLFGLMLACVPSLMILVGPTSDRAGSRTVAAASESVWMKAGCNMKTTFGPESPGPDSKEREIQSGPLSFTAGAFVCSMALLALVVFVLHWAWQAELWQAFEREALALRPPRKLGTVHPL